MSIRKKHLFFSLQNVYYSGNYYIADLTYRYSIKSFNKNWTGYSFYAYYNRPFEREAFWKAFNILFGR